MKYIAKLKDNIEWKKIFTKYLNDKYLRTNITGVSASGILPINHLRKYNIKIYIKSPQLILLNSQQKNYLSCPGSRTRNNNTICNVH